MSNNLLFPSSNIYIFISLFIKSILFEIFIKEICNINKQRGLFGCRKLLGQRQFNAQSKEREEKESRHSRGNG